MSAWGMTSSTNGAVDDHNCSETLTAISGLYSFLTGFTSSRWDANWSAGYANNSSLDTTSSRGAYQSLTTGAGLGRSLTEKLSVRLGYDFIHQRGSGQSQLFGDFDRDLWSVQFSYRFHEIALGR